MMQVSYSKLHPGRLEANHRNSRKQMFEPTSTHSKVVVFRILFIFHPTFLSRGPETADYKTHFKLLFKWNSSFCQIPNSGVHYSGVHKKRCCSADWWPVLIEANITNTEISFQDSSIQIQFCLFLFLVVTCKIKSNNSVDYWNSRHCFARCVEVR